MLQDALDSKQSLLSDVTGTGVSLRYGTKLRKLFGSGGIAVSHYVNSANLNDASNFHVKIDGAELQMAIAAVQQKVSAFSSTSFLPETTYATWVTGNLNIQAAKATHVFLTPLILAPEQNIELCVRNYSNLGGLSISNATGNVHIPTGLTTGSAGLILEGNIPIRHLLIDPDLGQKFRVGTNYVLALDASTANVQGGLSVSGNCSISGQLVVGSTNILDALTNAAQASTGPVAIADVTGLTAALSGKQATLPNRLCYAKKNCKTQITFTEL